MVHDRVLLDPRRRLILPGETNLLGNLYSFGAMLSFTIAHVAVIALRIKKPDQERPYRMPWNVRIRGATIPLTAVLGAIGTFAAWCAVVVLHPEARTIGIPWMLVGMVGYLVYRRRQGLDPRTTYKIERPQRPPDFEELDYRTRARADLRRRRLSAACCAAPPS